MTAPLRHAADSPGHHSLWENEKMNAIAKKNRIAIFGSDELPADRDCKIVGRLSRPIPGRLSVPKQNAADLWVWTAQPRRATQDVVARINLRKADAIEELRAAGVEV